jgi:hypothetical protein
VRQHTPLRKPTCENKLDLAEKEGPVIFRLAVVFATAAIVLSPAAWASLSLTSL